MPNAPSNPTRRSINKSPTPNDDQRPTPLQAQAESPAAGPSSQTRAESVAHSSGSEGSACVTHTEQLVLKDFVHAAWHILEPSSELLWNWHLDTLCEYLELIRREEFKKTFGASCEGLIVNVPPRTMKSLLITVFFPVWVWTRDPGRRFMFVSYSEKLSTQHSVYRRAVMESDWYQENWGTLFTFSRDQNLKHHYENSKRGIMFSTGMQATATGMGGDVLIFDDPLNPDRP
jgi:hypothetical protein